MVQFIYTLFHPKLGESAINTGASVANVIAQKERIPEENLIFLVGGRLLPREDPIDHLTTIHVSIKCVGGKGGYGNMLKKQAKKTNPNATLDFSACRDLNGRRMRFVNATVAMQKWKERLDRLEELKAENPNATLDDVPMETPNAGIYGWYSAVPGWAEGVKRSRAAFQKDQKKQKMCERWWEAHKDGKVPPNADPHYGCPRRDQCDFAHGLDELTGEGRALFLRDLERSRKQKEKEAIDSYIHYDDMAGDAVSAIEAGLKLKKEKKKWKRNLSPFDGDESGSSSMDTEFGSKKMKASSSVDTQFGSPSVDIPSKPKAPTQPADTQFASKLSFLTGKASIQNDGVVGAISSFPSIRLGNEIVVTGCYYFEVHLITGGLVQIGWCGKHHGCNEEEENGVGDDENSWSFDVVRSKKWHGDEGSPYGDPCQPGDVIGVLLNADKRTLSFSINGKDCGVAFTGVMGIGGLFPVISLEKEEAVLVNLGQFQFEYEPLEHATGVWEFAKKL